MAGPVFGAVPVLAPLMMSANLYAYEHTRQQKDLLHTLSSTFCMHSRTVLIGIAEEVGVKRASTHP